MRPTIGLAFLVLACAPAVTRPTSPIEAPSRPPRASAPIEDARCPDLAHVDLEPPTPAPDERTIALARLVREETSRGRIAGRVPTLDLGEVVVPRSGPPSSHGVVGLGWMGLDASWVAPSISPEIAASFEAWLAAKKLVVEHQTRSYLLSRHIRHARAIDSAGPWGGLRCLQRAAERADRDVEKTRPAVERTAAALHEAIEALPVLSSGDIMLLGHVLADALPRAASADAAARARAMFSLVADDETADRELRARAAEQLARLHRSDAPAFTTELERVLALTHDPELTVETLIKLADTSPDPVKAEKLRVEILRRVEADEDDWRLAQTLALLAENRLERGAFALARDDAIHCAKASAGEFPLDPDPWGCATVLAETLAELGAAPSGVEIPLPFLGPLALATMKSALDRHDRDHALHAGRLLLEVLPQAEQAPAALKLLIAIAPTETERRAWADEKARTYGPQGSWAASHRWALAWDTEPEQLERQLASLLDPLQTGGLPEPTTEDQLLEELRARATTSAGSCEVELSEARRELAVRVDTTGARPIASVRGGTPRMRACVRRSAQARFRSLDPLRVSFRVVAE